MFCILPVLLALSSLLPLWMISPPWKSWRKHGGSFPWLTNTCTANQTQTHEETHTDYTQSHQCCLINQQMSGWRHTSWLRLLIRNFSLKSDILLIACGCDGLILTCDPLWLPSSTVIRAEVPFSLTLEWRPCQKKQADLSLPGAPALSSPGFCRFPTDRNRRELQ